MLHYTKFVILSCVFSLFLLTVRVVYSNDIWFLFLIWNLLLAIVPYKLSLVIFQSCSPLKRTFKTIALLFLWILFFPNALYIITDFIHLRSQEVIPLWFDVIMLFSFTWSGIILGFASLFIIQQLIVQKYNERVGWVFAFVALFISSFGIYLGRFLRWNSWDVFFQPAGLFIDIANRILNPFAHPQTYVVTFIFTVFYLITYISFINFKAEAIIAKKR